MANKIKIKQIDEVNLTAFINEVLDGTGAVYTANRALVTDSLGDVVVSSVTSTELGYVSGVTSAIQTQLDAKQATITGGATTIVSSNLTASKALVSDGSGKVAVSSVTNTELGYVSGVTSAIQTQINAKFTLPSLTSGSILFSNGTTIIQDNANLYWDDTNNRLGVGTTSPQRLLHLNGTSSYLQFTNATTGSASSDGTLVGTSTGVDFYIYNQEATGNLRLFTAATERLRIDSAGNVGIGTSSPGAQLQVICGTSGTIGQIIKAAASQTSDLLQFQNSSGTVLTKVQSDGTLCVGTHSAVGAETITGYITIKDSGGTSRKIAVIS